MEREALFSSLTFDEDAIECIRVEDGFVSLFSAVSLWIVSMPCTIWVKSDSELCEPSTQGHL